MATVEVMTIHKALSELKMLDKRINDTISSGTYCIENKHSNKKIKGVSIDDFEKIIQGSYDKANQLIERRKAIKKAVVLSNAITKITVGGEKYVVAEAIEMKNHGIEYEKMLMAVMEQQYRKVQNAISMNNNLIEERADKYVIELYGQKEGKTNGDDVEKVRKAFLTEQSYDFIDPINVLSKIEDLKKKTSEFLSEVDSALSVSNALTEIKIEY